MDVCEIVYVCGMTQLFKVFMVFSLFYLGLHFPFFLDVELPDAPKVDGKSIYGFNLATDFSLIT